MNSSILVAMAWGFACVDGVKSEGIRCDDAITGYTTTPVTSEELTVRKTLLSLNTCNSQSCLSSELPSALLVDTKPCNILSKRSNKEIGLSTWCNPKCKIQRKEVDPAA